MRNRDIISVNRSALRNLSFMLNSAPLLLLEQLHGAAVSETSQLILHTLISLYGFHQHEPKIAEQQVERELESLKKLKIKGEGEKEAIIFLTIIFNVIKFKNQVAAHIPANYEDVIEQYQNMDNLSDQVNKVVSSVSDKSKLNKQSSGKRIDEYLPEFSSLNIESPVMIKDKIQKMNGEIKSLNKDVNALNQAISLLRGERINRLPAMKSIGEMNEVEAKNYLVKLEQDKARLNAENTQMRAIQARRVELERRQAKIKSDKNALESERVNYNQNITDVMKRALLSNVQSGFDSDRSFQQVERLKQRLADIEMFNKVAVDRDIKLPVFNEVSLIQKAAINKEVSSILEAFNNVMQEYNKLIDQTSQAGLSNKNLIFQASMAIEAAKNEQVHFTDEQLDAAVIKHIGSGIFSLKDGTIEMNELPANVDDDIASLNVEYGHIDEEIIKTKERIKSIKKSEADIATYKSLSSVLIDLYLTSADKIKIDKMNNNLQERFLSELMSGLREMYPDYHEDNPIDPIRSLALIKSLYAKYNSLSMIVEKCDHYEQHLKKHNDGISDDHMISKKRMTNNEIKEMVLGRDQQTKKAGAIMDELNKKLADPGVRKILSAHRDGFGIRLLKGILLVLSVGATKNKPGLWKSHGALHAERIESIVNPKKGRSRS